MLYATTRSKVETFTAQRVLRTDRAPDGGCFVPVQLPVYSAKEIRGLKDQTPGEIIARVMNQFFGTELSGRDVEFVLGRKLFNLVDMSHRITIAELFRNPEGSFDRLVRTLFQQVRVEAAPAETGEWMHICARIAFLCAVYGELQRKNLTDPRTTIDFAADSGDFRGPMAAWYARKMGLPIGNLIISCPDDTGLWDLLSRGQVRADAVWLDSSLERLIFAALGRSDAEQFVAECGTRGLYILNPEKQRLLRDGLLASVVSDRRMMQTIPNVYRTNGCILHPAAARTFAGVQDYRAVSGTNSLALMLALDSPVKQADAVGRSLHITEQELRERLDIL